MNPRRESAIHCVLQEGGVDPIAPNVLDRDFTAAGPNQRWVGDTSEFLIGEHGRQPGRAPKGRDAARRLDAVMSR